MKTTSRTSDKECQRVIIPANFTFLQITEEPTTKHPNENFLNLEEDLWGRVIELRAENKHTKRNINSKEQELQN